MTLVDIIQQLEELKEFKGGNEKQRDHLNEIVARWNALKAGSDNIAAGDNVKEIIVTIDGTSAPLSFLLESANDD